MSTGYIDNLISSTVFGCAMGYRDTKRAIDENLVDKIASERGISPDQYLRDADGYPLHCDLREAAKTDPRKPRYDALGTSLGVAAGLCGGIGGFALGLVGRHCLDGCGCF